MNKLNKHLQIMIESKIVIQSELKQKILRDRIVINHTEKRHNLRIWI